MAKKETLTRVVIGPKVFHHKDPKTGNRYKAEPGDEIEVSAACAAAFPHRLIDPGVAEAQAVADKAVKDAAAKAEAAREESIGRARAEAQDSEEGEGE